MPLYPYRCEKCEHDFETLSMKSDPEKDVECPQCGTRKVRRVIGVPTAGTAKSAPLTNCRGDGPPCGASGCGRMPN